MRINRNQSRALYAFLVIVAFFIPAYSQVSAFSFLFMAIDAVGTDSEVTLLDLLVVLIPLLLIPITALFILIRAVNKKPLSSLLLCLPFFSIVFFFLILSMDMVRQVSTTTMLNLLAEMSIGFYLATFAGLMLLFSYSRRESLNLRSGRS